MNRHCISDIPLSRHWKGNSSEWLLLFVWMPIFYYHLWYLDKKYFTNFNTLVIYTVSDSNNPKQVSPVCVLAVHLHQVLFSRIIVTFLHELFAVLETNIPQLYFDFEEENNGFLTNNGTDPETFKAKILNAKLRYHPGRRSKAIYCETENCVDVEYDRKTDFGKCFM